MAEKNKKRPKVIYEIHTGGYTFKFRKPTLEDIQMYGDMSFNSPTRATYNFIMNTLIEPSREEAAKIFQEEPGLVLAIGSQLLREVGLITEITVKKVEAD